MDSTTASALAGIDLKLARIEGALDRIQSGSALLPDQFYETALFLRCFRISRGTWLQWEREGRVPPRVVLPTGTTGHFGSTLQAIRASWPTVHDGLDARFEDLKARGAKIASRSRPRLSRKLAETSAAS